MRRCFAFASILLTSLSLVACSVLGDETSSQESDHTEGEPTFAQHAWQWSDETFEEFKQVRDENAYYGADEYLPLDHPMTQRLQFWIDRIDEALRAKHPEKLKATPPPKIVVKKTSEQNAWVSFMPVAWDVKTRFASAGNGEDADAGAAPANTDGGVASDAGTLADGGPDVPPPPAPAGELLLKGTGVISNSFATPLVRPHDDKALSEFIAYYNEGFAKCRLSLEGGEVVFGDQCVQAPEILAKTGNRLAYYATGKHVTFTSGYLLELLDEDRVISTLAHELGHYYRSHANMPSDVVNYFYALGDANAAHKPSPDPRYLEQTAAVRDKLRGADWFTNFTEENKLMVDQRLGFYTDEQEADEISLEILALIGIPPSTAVDKLLTVLRMSEKMGGEGGDTLGYKECSALREAGWRDAEGKLVSVPVGNLTDTHHSLCFRAFNVARELAAHKYTVAAERPSPPGEEWSQLIARVSAETNPTPPPPGDGGAEPADGGVD